MILVFMEMIWSTKIYPVLKPILKVLIGIIRWIWFLPQNLVGGFIALYCFLFQRKHTRFFTIQDGTIFVISDKQPLWGISLGDFIILKEDCFHRPCVIRHEYGHRVQAWMTGPLYLLIIGLPSLINHQTHKTLDGTYKEKTEWYYGRYPEKGADKLGKVKPEMRFKEYVYSRKKLKIKDFC